MKIFFSLILCTGLIVSAAYGVDSDTKNPLSEKEQDMLLQCNLEARNSLIHGDLALVERLCMKAANDLEKNHTDKKYIINPLMNLGFSYSLAGHHEKALPLYSRAREICVHSYGKDSEEVKKIDNLIKRGDLMKNQTRR